MPIYALQTEAPILTPSGAILTPSGDTITIVHEAPETPREAGGGPPAKTVPRKVADPATWSSPPQPGDLRAPLTEQDVRARQAEEIADLHRKVQLADADGSRMRGELRRSSEELTAAQQQHEVETRLAAQRESDLRDELAGAHSELSAAIESASGSRRIWLGVAAAIAAAPVFWASMVYWQLRQTQRGGTEGGTRENKTAAAATLNESAAAAAAVPAPPARMPVEAETNDFTEAVSQLDQALSRFSGNKPEYVLRQVRKENAVRGVSVCSFEWNNGQPSLLFGTGESLELETAVGRCAEAVEKAAK